MAVLNQWNVPLEWNSGMTFLNSLREWRGPNMLLMHMVLQFFQKGVHVQVRPLSTAQWQYSVDSLPPNQSHRQTEPIHMVVGGEVLSP